MLFLAVLLGALVPSSSGGGVRQTPGILVYGDDRLAAEALLAIAGHESSLRYGISARAEEGAILLEGSVPEANDRSAAEAALGGILGARRIVNRIEVDPSIGWAGPVCRDDRTVERQVRRALRASPRFGDLTAACRTGEVVLSGETDGWDGLREGVEAVLRIGGIRKLRSEVAVLAAPPGGSTRSSKPR
ncbi:MAG TPA: BON domain-containing protein [Planctomycetota bacterium]|jgi:osmotically-inducible protein OsmY|nr:BON domain-containing protein [Planctomycetota bacterium]